MSLVVVDVGCSCCGCRSCRSCRSCRGCRICCYSYRCCRNCCGDHFRVMSCFVVGVCIRKLVAQSGSDLIRPREWWTCGGVSVVDLGVVCVGFASVGEWLWWRGRYQVVSSFVAEVCTRKLAAKSKVNLIQPRLS